jgi:hypothetical protein
MTKVIGIKSVDFSLVASGVGVVNNNGSVSVQGPDGKEINNHMMPKLRGYTNESGKIKEDNGYRFKKKATEVDFKENPLYISQNCIRHHLFKDQSHDFHFASKKGTDKDPKKLLLSISGLLRGYVLPATQNKRTSPLLIEDFVDQLGNGNFEQFGNSGEKDSNSIYSKTTFGETKYLAKGSLSIEQLQFISLDKKFDRESIVIKNEKEGNALAQELTEFLSDLEPDSKLSPVAEYGNYYRIGSIYHEPEVGILLNNDAITLLVNLMMELIQGLSIRQAKGWMSVDSVEMDYNDSTTMMRIHKDKDNVNEELSEDFAVYYAKVEE